MTMRFRWKALAQLMRLPNLFTAFADIGLGWLAALATGTPSSSWLSFLLLIGASGCLYSAGMVWNDFFDVEQDRRERPFRPIPSGRVSRSAAGAIGAVLILLGLLFAGLVQEDNGQGIVIAGILVAAILLYDAWLKRTVLGPIAMGSCRFLNVLLGLVPASSEYLPWSARFYVAGVVGTYIVGITWFARKEASRSERSALQGAAATILAALVAAMAVPVWIERAVTSPLFPYLLVGLGFLVGIPIAQAIERPKPEHIQAAVKRALIGLVVLDAVLATGIAGIAGLLLLLLLLPMLYLGRYVYST
jgi:4-hydroxybenzoate polyprenyltransferase